jgi:hypothetical protein
MDQVRIVMGIRVHKAIGYGVTNLKHRCNKSGVRMSDPRINWDLFSSCGEKDCTWEEFLQWCLEHISEIYALYKNDTSLSEELLPDEFHWLKRTHKNIKLWSSFRHDSEFGLPGTLLIIPPEMKDWFRYDDAIDWEEETRRHQQKSRVELLRPFGIYPYSNFMVRFRDPPSGIYDDPGNVLNSYWRLKYPEDATRDNLELVKLSPSVYSQLIGTWEGLGKPKPIVKGAALKHLKNDWRSQIPLTVISLILWSGCFTDPKSFIDELKPLLYVWWS